MCIYPRYLYRHTYSPTTDTAVNGNFTLMRTIFSHGGCAWMMGDDGRRGISNKRAFKRTTLLNLIIAYILRAGFDRSLFVVSFCTFSVLCMIRVLYVQMSKEINLAITTTLIWHACKSLTKERMCVYICICVGLREISQFATR